MGSSGYCTVHFFRGTSDSVRRMPLMIAAVDCRTSETIDIGLTHVRDDHDDIKDKYDRRNDDVDEAQDYAAHRHAGTAVFIRISGRTAASHETSDDRRHRSENAET